MSTIDNTSGGKTSGRECFFFLLLIFSLFRRELRLTAHYRSWSIFSRGERFFSVCSCYTRVARFKNFEIFSPSSTLHHFPILTHPCLLSAVVLRSSPLLLSTAPLAKNPSLYALRLSPPKRLSKAEFRFSGIAHLVHDSSGTIGQFYPPP